MSVAFVKKASGQSAAASTSITLTMASAPALGNLLVFMMAGDKNTGALTLAGWTQVYTLNSTSVSLYFWYRVSDGTETAITPSWASSSATGNVGWYGEFADASVGGSTWQISAQSSHNTDETNVTSWSTGTTGTISLAGLALAMIAMDSADSVTDGTTAWTNSYASLFTTLASAGARGGLHISDLSVGAGGTTETTFSFTPSTTLRDQLSGAVVVFSKVASDVSATAGQASAAGAGQDVSASLSGLPDTPFAAGTGQDVSASLSALPDTPFAAGSAFNVSASLSALPDTPSAAGASETPGGVTVALPGTPVGAGTSGGVLGSLAATSGFSVAFGEAFDASAPGQSGPTGHESTEGREPPVRLSGMEPDTSALSGRASGGSAGYGPVSSGAGNEPRTRLSGQEASHT